MPGDQQPPTGPEECPGQARAPPLTQIDDLERREEAVLPGQVLPRRFGAVVLDEGEAAGAQDVVVGARHGPVEVRQAELVVVDRAVGHAEGGPVRQAPLHQVPRQHLRGAGLRAGGGAHGPGPAQQQPQRGLVGPPQGLHARARPRSRPRAPGGAPLGGGASWSACARALPPPPPPARSARAGNAQRAARQEERPEGVWAAARAHSGPRPLADGRAERRHKSEKVSPVTSGIVCNHGAGEMHMLNSQPERLAGFRPWASGKSLRDAEEPEVCPALTSGDLGSTRLKTTSRSR